MTLPEEKQDAVARGLREAFGVTDFDDLRQLTKGQSSSLVYRIVVQGSPYLLKLIMRQYGIGPERQFECMRAAATAGLAPKVWYTSVPDGISITDFIEEVALPPHEALIRMPTVLRTLHGLSAHFRDVEDQFNTTCMFLLNKGTAAGQFIQKVLAANVFSPLESEALLGWYQQIVAVYPHQDSERVPSHNDLFKRDNILFDGSVVWLVDWEAAFQNDRYVDLAAVANLVVASQDDEDVYLETYFGQRPGEYQRSRFFLMKQLMHIFYAMVFRLPKEARENFAHKVIESDINAMRMRMWAGDVNLSDPETKNLYGTVHWEQLAANMRDPKRFQEALGIVAARH